MFIDEEHYSLNAKQLITKQQQQLNTFFGMEHLDSKSWISTSKPIVQMIISFLTMSETIRFIGLSKRFGTKPFESLVTKHQRDLIINNVSKKCLTVTLYDRALHEQRGSGFGIIRPSCYKQREVMRTLPNCTFHFLNSRTSSQTKSKQMPREPFLTSKCSVTRRRLS